MANNKHQQSYTNYLKDKTNHRILLKREDHANDLFLSSDEDAIEDEGPTPFANQKSYLKKGPDAGNQQNNKLPTKVSIKSFSLKHQLNEKPIKLMMSPRDGGPDLKIKFCSSKVSQAIASNNFIRLRSGSPG